MIDAHCHLNFHSFENDLDQVIQNARQAGIRKIINVGTQVSSSQLAVDLAEKYDDLYASIAIHPHHADKINSGQTSPENWLNQLQKLATHPKVVSIGECGLDYFSYKSNGIVEPKIQKEIFLAHLHLASKFKLPLQIHTRVDQARIDVIEILRHNKHLLQNRPGIFHCMAGSIESAGKILDLGFSLGFDGNITYGSTPPGEPIPLRDLVSFAPIDSIVIETDSPYLTPHPHRSERNEPKYAIITAKYIADLKKISFEEVVEQTDKNVYTIFNKLKKPGEHQI